MPATANTLRELHQLHQRAKALRDRLTSAPKTLAARQAALTNRQAALENARKTLQEAKVQLRKREHLLQGHQAKIDDLKVKLNQVRKNDEYKAIQNQLAHEKATLSKLEDEVLEGDSQIESQTAALDDQEAEIARFAAEVVALRDQVESNAGAQQAQLAELETAIADAEAVIPEDVRDHYRRLVKQHGADALAFVEDGACSGCFVSVTAQVMNELINALTLCFCKTCGRLLYLAEEDVPTTRRSSR
jgi:predicted  nucleic acid-binding Zn-ribbon protein